MRKLILLAVIGAALAIAAPPAAHGAGGVEKCGKHIVNGGGWWKLKAEGASCRTARKVADHFVFEAGGIDDHFQDWVCVKARTGDEVWQVQCSRRKDERNQVLRFLYGA